MAAGVARRRLWHLVIMAANNELVTLNVGGKLFHTTRATLTKHPDSMLAGMFRGGMQATALRDEAGHPFLDRDLTHFSLILAYLRDSRVPPLPQTALELRQLEVEASFYAMAELADAMAAAAAPLEAAAAAAQQVERRRAEAVQAADAALEKAQAEVAAVEALPEMQQLWEAQRKRDSLRARSMEDPELVDEWIDAHHAVEALESEQHMQLPLLREKNAARQLRDALVARLCALGVDMPAAQAQLLATHPDLAKRSLD